MRLITSGRSAIATLLFETCAATISAVRIRRFSLLSSAITLPLQRQWLAGLGNRDLRVNAQVQSKRMAARRSRNGNGARRYFRAAMPVRRRQDLPSRSEEHKSELQSIMPTSYAVFC